MTYDTLCVVKYLFLSGASDMVTLCYMPVAGW